MSFYLRKKDLKNVLHQSSSGSSVSKDLQGPFNKAQIFQFLFSGCVDKNALLFKDKTFQPIEKEFEFFFDESISWSLLKKYQNTFKKSSGYSRKGLQSLLEKGWISDKDFVWKAGFKSWERISLCSEFHTPLSSSVEDCLDKHFLEEKNTFSQVLIYQRPAPCLSDLRWKK